MFDPDLVVELAERIDAARSPNQAEDAARSIGFRLAQLTREAHRARAAGEDAFDIEDAIDAVDRLSQACADNSDLGRKLCGELLRKASILRAALVEAPAPDPA